MKLNIVLGIITIAIAFVVFPIITESVGTLLADTNITNFTGLQSILKICPLIVLVSMLFGGGLLVFKGVKEYRGRRTGKKAGKGR